MSKKKKATKHEEVETVEADPEEGSEEELEYSPQVIVMEAPSSSEDEPKLRKINIIGDIDEEKTPDILYSMWHLNEAGKKNGEDGEETREPMEIVISTYGGAALEMFSIYDVMRMIREESEVRTLGLGKVMSAGVLLLAAGTKGSRRIGKNCRVMIHSVMGGQHGPVYNMENEMEEIKWIQEQYLNSLIEETDMTKKYLKKLLGRKVNVYLTAEEAVELGIADEII
tara:strand:+ start:1414 stop:2091 length:678 start_codon:yes stop_codon:yes gene_type:complete